MKYQASFLLSSLLAVSASLGVSLTSSEAHAQACSSRAKVMFCGSTSRPKAQIFTNTANYTIVDGCTPDADTKALFISRSGTPNGPVFRAYLDAGGVIITEFSRAYPVYNAIYNTSVLQGSFSGACRDNTMASQKLSLTHPFWVANNIAPITQAQEGCGYSLESIVTADNQVTALGGWLSRPGSVSLAVRPQGNGFLYLVEADWQDNEQGADYNVQQSRDVLGAMADTCGTCASNAECGAAEVCDLASSNQCEPINTCGNGTVEAGEGCDDGEQVDGDGCSATCLIEIGGPCTNSNQCGTGLCDGNICACNDNNDCSMGYVCDTAMSPNSCEPAINYSTTIDQPVDGVLLNTDTLVISGTTEANASVEVTIDGQVAGVVTANAMGQWSFMASNIAEGAHTTSVVATDGLGNSAPAGPVSFNIDTIAPAPAITAPVAGANLSNNTPVISGTTEALATVVVSVDGQVVGTVNADAAGSWTYTSASLADGAHNVSVASTDAAGNSGAAGPVSFNIDTVAPAPAIAAPVADANLSNNTPVISGTSEAGASVEVSVDGQIVGTVTADAAGSWTYTSMMLADGAHNVSVTSSDAAGNSGSAGPVGFNVDTVDPAPAITAPVAGANLNTATPVISGTTEAGASVEVSVDGQIVGTVTAGANGAWTYTSAMLADGAHNVSVVSTDAAGNSGAAGPVSFNIDTIAPAPAIATPVADANLSNNTPVISGTSEAGADVVISVDGQVVSTVVADANGDWTYTSAMLADGAHNVSVTSSDAAGNSGAAGPVSFNVDTVAPAPTIVNPAADSYTSNTMPLISGTSENSASVTVRLLDAQGAELESFTTTADVASGAWMAQVTVALVDGAYSVEVTSVDAAGNSGSVTSSFNVDSTALAIDVTTPPMGQMLNVVRPEIAGTTAPAVMVTVIIKDDQGADVETLMATADANGDWSVTPSQDLADGEYTAEAIVANLAGLESSDTTSFTVDTAAPAVTLTSPVEGDQLDTTTPTFSGTSEPGATVTVVITNGAGEVVETLMATADANGDWSATPSQGLPEGGAAVVVTSTDAAGNETTLPAVNINVDATAPTTAITSPTAGQVFTDAKPTITGTSDAGAAVEVSVDGQVIDTVTAGADGSWSLALEAELADGEHTVSATGTDAAGNSSTAGPVSFSIDTMPPAVAITSPVAGDSFDKLPINVTGTSEPGATIEVIINGEVVATVTADGSGNWSYDVTTLPSGQFTLKVKATDANGLSQESEELTLSLDTAKPVVVEGGCGCGSTQGSSPAGSMLLLTLAMGLGWFRRRRR